MSDEGILLHLTFQEAPQKALVSYAEKLTSLTEQFLLPFLSNAMLVQKSQQAKEKHFLSSQISFKTQKMRPIERFMFLSGFQRRVFTNSLGNLLADVRFFESLLFCLVTPPRN